MNAPTKTSLEQFQEMEQESPELVEETPLERLRYFCSLAMIGQDWLDVEQFFIAVENQILHLEGKDKPLLPEFSTIEQIADNEFAQLKPEDVPTVLELGNNGKLGSLHHSYGMYIRNTYGLWHTSPLTEKWRTDPSTHRIIDGVDYSLDHPDNISMAIIEALYSRVKANASNSSN